jgi:hypothetical protein
MSHKQTIEEILLSKLPVFYVTPPLISGESKIYAAQLYTSEYNNFLFNRFSYKYPETITQTLQKDITQNQAFDLVLKEGSDYYKCHVQPTLCDYKESWWQEPALLLFNKNSIEWEIDSCDLIDNIPSKDAILIIE